MKYFDSIFRGAGRESLPIDHEKYKRLVNTREKFTAELRRDIEALISSGLSCSEVVSKTGISRTSFHRIKKKMKEQS